MFKHLFTIGDMRLLDADDRRASADSLYGQLRGQLQFTALRGGGTTQSAQGLCCKIIGVGLSRNQIQNIVCS